MSVLKQNPFLAGFGAVMLVGVGALGYLTYSAADANSKELEKYTTAENELKRLYSARPYPSAENVKVMVDRRKEVQVKVDGLQKELAGAKIKIEEIQPAAFQDKLKDAVALLQSKAPEAKVILPGAAPDSKEKFYFGFNLYQSELPKPAAAPLLYRQLRAMEAVMNVIIDAKGVEVKDVIRQELKEEKDIKPAPAADPKGKKGSNNKADDDSSDKAVQKQSFTIKFAAPQDIAQRILNGIVGNKQQLFVIRHLAVHSAAQEPPSKNATANNVIAPPVADPNAAVPTPVAAPADPNAPAAIPAPTPGPGIPPVAPVASAGKKETIFGAEHVEMTLQIEIIDVQEPTAAAPAKNSAKAQDK